MYGRFLEEVRAAGLPSEPPNETPLSEAGLSVLPETAARYLRFMGVVGRARDWSFRARVVGRFRLKPGQG